MCQVGAIILYTYVFQMLAPPPEGSFEIEAGNLPIKNPPKNCTPEQAPLLTQEPESMDSNKSKGGKVRRNSSSLSFSLFSFLFLCWPFSSSSSLVLLFFGIDKLGLTCWQFG
uniref:Uncharacterized protein n=1 Tax=Nelumbo nucifera TaxID=4432 RepID=A0A822Z0P5_NELNU|nr:TPA_asm: hypothetical protein HUJ06_012874 [Nelumbo nucifera]